MNNVLLTKYPKDKTLDQNFSNIRNFINGNTIENTIASMILSANSTLVALGGGAAPTFGTIGGSGPTAAAQNGWISIQTTSGTRFIPCWI
jgi:hypothetical protein